MSDELKELIEQARCYKPTPQEKRDHRISFAYGSAHYENRDVTREDVVRAAAMLDGESMAEGLS